MLPNGIMPDAIENAARHRKLAKSKENERSPGAPPSIQWESRHDGYVASGGSFSSIPAMLAMLLLLTVGAFSLAALFLFPLRAGLLHGNHMWLSLPLAWGVAALIGYALYRGARSLVLDKLNSPSELILSRWPLHFGDTARVGYRGRSRPSWKVDKIELFLDCNETREIEVSTDTGKEGRIQKSAIRHDSQGVATPVPNGTGGFQAEWTLRMPDDGPSSFVHKFDSVDWYLTVVAKDCHGRASGWGRRILVVPKQAR